MTSLMVHAVVYWLEHIGKAYADNFSGAERHRSRGLRVVVATRPHGID